MMLPGRVQFFASATDQLYLINVGCFTHLLPKCDIRSDKPLSKDHAVLKMHVFVTGCMNEEEISSNEAIGHFCEI